VRVFPRLEPSVHRVDYRPEPASSGIAELDHMLGGGLDRGTTTLLLGPAGSGKSSLALQYAAARAGAGENVLVFTFDETRSLLLARAGAFGMALARLVTAGLITINQIDPAELSPGEFATLVQKGVHAGARVVVIDSLNGYLNAMPGEQYLANQLHELCSMLNQKQVLTILVLAQQGMVGSGGAPVDLSYLADTIVTLRFFEAAGEVRQAIAVMKKRSGGHEKTIREFKLDAGIGVRVGNPLRDFQGVLTGVPQFVGAAGDMMGAPGNGKRA
jgi:circadian clock protein KaiC